ncbi:MAG: pentapeptide repeat-containing protein [Rhizobiaceae bacterium]
MKIRESNKIRRSSPVFLAFLALALGTPQVQAAQCDHGAEAGVDWSGCRKRNLLLDGSNLAGAQLGEADFTSTDLRNSSVEKANLSKAALVRSMFDNSRAMGANFEKAVGFRTSFAGTDLSGATFIKSEMQRADFTKANLAGVDFKKSELGRAIFTGANIEGTSFSFANLARADLRGATFHSPIDFTGAYFYLTRIENVDLSEATGISQWQADMSCGDSNTKLPADITTPQTWPCQEE